MENVNFVENQKKEVKGMSDLFEEDDISELDEIDENEIFDVAETDEPIKPFLALCEKCNEPLYKKTDIHRIETKKGSRILCMNCYNKVIANAKAKKQKEVEEIEKLEKMELKEQSKKATKRLIHSLIWPTLLSLIWFISAFTDKSFTTPGIIMGFFNFAWWACLFLKNNFVTNCFYNVWHAMVSEHAGMNIILWLLGWFAIVFIVMIAVIIFTVIVSPVAYIFALINTIKTIKEGKAED